VNSAWRASDAEGDHRRAVGDRRHDRRTHGDDPTFSKCRLIWIKDDSRRAPHKVAQHELAQKSRIAVALPLGLR
jgi:hypothetical protein